MIILTGGSGLLGTHLKLDAYRPTHDQFDICNLDVELHEQDPDMIVHAAAWTNVARAEEDKMACFDVNVRGTLNLLLHFPNTPIVFISSEYAHNPVNFYGLTKNLAEGLVTHHTAPYLIIRTLFKPDPWPHEYAFTDQFTLGSYVTDIAPKIDKEIMEWDKKSKMIYVGYGGRKSMYELARETKIDVKPNKTSDIKNVRLPKDYK